MQVVHTVAELRVALLGKAGIGFVPTMGNLHAGHVSLVKLAKQYTPIVVVSIFVNPLQFGVNEDFGKYPRTLNADCAKLEGFADIVFAPSVEEMYPDFDGKHSSQTMLITPPLIANDLCGVFRPGHFSGVATVVLKLFNMVFANTGQPNIAVFGKKDFQQLFIIKSLVRQFNLPIRIVEGETIREANGLAMSSRNGYLTDEQKIQAALLQQVLKNIVQKILDGGSDYEALTQNAMQHLLENDWKVDYVEVRSASTLLPAQAEDKVLVVLAAASFGHTRLIDNIDFALSV